MKYKEYKILFIIKKYDKINISNIFFIKILLIIKYIYIIYIFDNKLSYDEIFVFINILIIFSNIIIFLKFDIIYFNILFMNIISKSISRYNKLFHIISFNLINFH